MASWQLYSITGNILLLWQPHTADTFVRSHTRAGYLRLGCMARDKQQTYEASDWFKDALQVTIIIIQFVY